MKKTAFIFAILYAQISYAAVVNPFTLNSASTNNDSIAMTTKVNRYIAQAQQQQLDQQKTWQRLMYANQNAQKNTNHNKNRSHKNLSPKIQSEVEYAGYFLSKNGQYNLKEELNANIEALFKANEPNQSVRCVFPARSQWLIEQLNISQNELPEVACPELDKWMEQIKPHKATLIYATDFMGNPSSMFGHTLLRLDPKDQKELNLVSYAVNYAAMVESGDDLAFAWKGLTGQYPGEYSLMPYYRKVKEYGDFESRDLWEYELSLNPEETRFLVQHMWEMKNVKFPYYFVNDNCAYRLLGLLDLVRPEAHLQEKFRLSAIPIETIKAIDQHNLIKDIVYRPALETQLLSQAKTHGYDLAKVAHELAFSTPEKMPNVLKRYSELDQAKILEMAYDDLYLQFVGRKVDEDFAQPRLRVLLSLRSQSNIEKQRLAPDIPPVDPTQSHHARNLSLKTGEVQGQHFVEIGHRQAYHDLIDPQGGYRLGTQLMFGDFSIQYRDDRLKLNHLDLLSVNSFNPITPFKTPLSWGFNVGWQQQSLDGQGQFSEFEQHGVLNIKSQFGYSVANQARQHLCYVQVQNQVQAGKALDKGWRLGVGPTLGCQNIWTERVNSLTQVELPYWEDAHAWNLRFNSTLQFQLNPQNAVRVGWEYQSQQGDAWDKWNIAYVNFF